MSQNTKPQVLIVGAGSVGVVTGYLLDLAGADVTFLVRQHRLKALEQTQSLYCYDDNTVKQYNSYTTTADLDAVKEKDYDFVIITLDGAAIQSDDGRAMTKAVGAAAQNKSTKIVFISVGIGLRQWFIETSGLTEDQVINGCALIHVYSPKSVSLPHPATVPTDKLAGADFAYADGLGNGYVVADTTLAASTSFKELYNRCGVSKCELMPSSQIDLMVHPLFPIFLGSRLMGWPDYKDMDPSDANWKAAVAASREIQGLSAFGEAGRAAAASTTPEGLLGMLREWEQKMLPLPSQPFYRYHHGGKVFIQDLEHLQRCLAMGEAEGHPMSSLKELLKTAGQEVI